MKQYLLVVFVNSLISRDYDMLKEFENFNYIISKGSVVRKVKNQYPNFKNPVNTTILTGEFPEKHGIYFNNYNVKVRKYRHKEYEDIQSPNILDLFKSEGNNVSLISWPNMGYSNFKYNFSDINNSVNIKDLFRGIVKGSSFYMLKNIFKYSSVLRVGIQPDSDNFSSILAMEILESKKSNVIFMNLDHLDYVRQRYGMNCEKNSLDALRNIDRKLGDLLVWCDNKNILNNLTISLVSGGGPCECKYIININYIFLKNGLISVNKRGRINNYIAYAHCEGGSAFIYLKQPNNINDYGKVKVFLDDIMKKYSNYIKAVYEVSEYERFDLDEFSFRIQGNIFCIFSEELNKSEFIDDMTQSLYISDRINKSFYGYSNDYENSQGIFINHGYRIKKGVELNECSLVDIAPTIASFMKLDFRSSGRIIKDILEEH
ncbi:alkaline phosphatase family protein [Candidatus Arthromitus sp. SFB-rat-Yit]|uniref:alkaline phosphatase family protein n=1 Tax=Candidatus Arthromitus sp. SFB-rat-Yit TaxID=1041504 RepID=UPI000227A752|nr:alkaline phosphatase family protein [Candidatus Arthromitus sp. SFB-rat-Yit]BAK80678.1 type I phosphodiesterase/nucleotide pyrophosphatase [Candidatus Arthromitus sp. SFB-rat-Yit]